MPAQNEWIVLKQYSQITKSSICKDEYYFPLQKSICAGCQWLMPVISGGRGEEDPNLKPAWENS
jgi:hypothetical protein